MYSVVVLGEKDKILPFGVLGMRLQGVGSTGELEGAFNLVLQEPRPGLIIISEDILGDSPQVLSRLRKKTSIPVLVLPSHLGSRGVSLKEMAGMIKRAVGVDILEGV